MDNSEIKKELKGLIKNLSEVELRRYATLSSKFADEAKEFYDSFSKEVGDSTDSKLKKQLESAYETAKQYEKNCDAYSYLYGCLISETVDLRKTSRIVENPKDNYTDESLVELCNKFLSGNSPKMRAFSKDDIINPKTTQKEVKQVAEAAGSFFVTIGLAIASFFKKINAFFIGIDEKIPPFKKLRESFPKFKFAFTEIAILLLILIIALIAGASSGSGKDVNSPAPVEVQATPVTETVNVAAEAAKKVEDAATAAKKAAEEAAKKAEEAALAAKKAAEEAAKKAEEAALAAKKAAEEAAKKAAKLSFDDLSGTYVVMGEKIELDVSAEKATASVPAIVTENDIKEALGFVNGLYGDYLKDVKYSFDGNTLTVYYPEGTTPEDLAVALDIIAEEGFKYVEAKLGLTPEVKSEETTPATTETVPATTETTPAADVETKKEDAPEFKANDNVRHEISGWFAPYTIQLQNYNALNEDRMHGVGVKLKYAFIKGSGRFGADASFNWQFPSKNGELYSDAFRMTAYVGLNHEIEKFTLFTTAGIGFEIAGYDVLESAETVKKFDSFLVFQFNAGLSYDLTENVAAGLGTELSIGFGAVEKFPLRFDVQAGLIFRF